MELAVWDVYFRDHPREWERFAANPGQGYSRDEKDPIDYCAHREVEFYLNYVKSLLQLEPSKISLEALSLLKTVKSDLNEVVHPGAVAHSAARFVPFDEVNSMTLGNLQKIQRVVFANASIVIAATYRRQFDALPAVHRAHFDWLVGSGVQKRIRSGPFGL